MNNVENPWLREEQKKLIAEAFPAWWKPRIIPWIRTYNLQQLPPSDRPKWLSAEHKAQLISATNLELGQHAATARTPLPGPSAAPSLQPWPGPSLAWAGPCPAYCTIVIITLSKIPLGDGWSPVYLLIFSSHEKRNCHQCIMGRAFCALLWPPRWMATGGAANNVSGESPGVNSYKSRHLKKNSGTKASLK